LFAEARIAARLGAHVVATPALLQGACAATTTSVMQIKYAMQMFAGFQIAVGSTTALEPHRTAAMALVHAQPMHSPVLAAASTSPQRF